MRWTRIKAGLYRCGRYRIQQHGGKWDVWWHNDLERHGLPTLQAAKDWVAEWGKIEVS